MWTSDNIHVINFPGVTTWNQTHFGIGYNALCESASRYFANGSASRTCKYVGKVCNRRISGSHIRTHARVHDYHAV